MSVIIPNIKRKLYISRYNEGMKMMLDHAGHNSCAGSRPKALHENTRFYGNGNIIAVERYSKVSPSNHNWNGILNLIELMMIEE